MWVQALEFVKDGVVYTILFEGVTKMMLRGELVGTIARVPGRDLSLPYIATVIFNEGTSRARREQLRFPELDDAKIWIANKYNEQVIFPAQRLAAMWNVEVR